MSLLSQIEEEQKVNQEKFNLLVYNLTYSEIPEKYTRLQVIIQKQHIDKFNINVVEYIITLNTTLVNETNARGETPLFEAVKLNNVPLTQLLLNYGANVLHKRHDTLTAIHIAVKYNSLDVFLIITNLELNYTDLKLLDFINEYKLFNDCLKPISHNLPKFADVSSVAFPIEIYNFIWNRLNNNN